jgi:predicted ATPase/class 3 adenylate cyclase
LVTSNPVANPQTFLFTDIAGSTALWEQEPAAMTKLLQRHDDVMDEIIASHLGRVFKHTGDGICAVFDGPRNAVRCAVAVQLEAMSALHIDAIRLELRVSIHTGLAASTGDDFRGQALNRCARLLSATHPGQILVSRTTEQLVRDIPEPDMDLIDLGEHRLRGLDQAERIFQVTAPGLRTSFPSLLAVPHVQHNMPAYPSSFVGRETESIDLASLLQSHRMVTLTGPPGVGKTRLATEVGAKVAARQQHGAWMVPLANIESEDLLAPAVARSLGLTENPATAIEEQLATHLESRDVLLVFDNCEHLIGGIARLVSDLLLAAPRLRVLATSREPLRIPGERVWRLSSLPYPDESTAPAASAGFDAVRLFVDRAASADRTFRTGPETLPAVVAVSQRLEGLPLAIEVAAARLAAMPVQELAARLDDRFASLVGSQRTASARHHTLWTTLEWSYEALDHEEQRWFRSLAAFEGGFSPEAAAAVGGNIGTGNGDVVSVLTRFVDMSLLERLESMPVRYRMLRSIREYAAMLLDDAGEDTAVRDAHAGYYVELATAQRSELYGPAQEEWLDRFNRDRENFRGAFSWMMEHGDHAGATRLASALGRFWFDSNRHREARATLSRVLEADHGEPAPELLDAVSDLSLLAMWAGDLDEAQLFADRAEAIAHRLDETALARVWNLRASIAWGRGRLGQAVGYMDHAVAGYRAVNSPTLPIALGGYAFLLLVTGRSDEARIAADDLDALVAGSDWPEGEVLRDDVAGWFFCYDDDLDSAAAHWANAAAGYRRLGLHPNLTELLQLLAWVALHRRDCDEARRLAEESLGLADVAGSQGMRARGEALLGESLVLEGHVEEGRNRLRRSLDRSTAVGDRYAALWAVFFLARAEIRGTGLEKGAVLLGAARTLLDEVGMVLPPPIAAQLEQTIDAVRSGLGDDRFLALEDRGRSASFSGLPRIAAD